MHLLTVIHHPVFGGPHNQAVVLNQVLLEAGVLTTVVLPLGSGEAAARMEAAGLDVEMLPLHRLRAARELRSNADLARGLASEVRALRALIRCRGADIVQVNGLVNPHAAIAARLEGRAVVWQLQDTRTPSWLRAMSMPMVLSLADVVMTTGHAVRRVHPGLVILGSRVLPYYPPVDTDVYRPRPDLRAQARARLGVAGCEVIVASLGNVNPQKGHEYAIRAVAAEVAGGADMALRILGSHSATQSGYEDSLTAEATRGRLVNDGRFSVVEPRQGLAELLPGVDIGVLAAVPLSEGVPTMILEAMSAGTAVVATDVGGVREAIRDGIDGLVVDPLRPDRLAAALHVLAATPSLRESLGREARRSVLARFSLRQSAATHLRAYETARRYAARRRRVGR